MTSSKAENPMARGGLFALAAAVAFGITTPLVKKLGVGAGPFPTAMLLYAGAALASAPWIGRRASTEASLRRRQVPRLVAVTLAGGLLAPACLAWGLQHTSATSASLLLNFEAAFTVLLGWCFYREHLGRRVVAALVLMLAGGACLVGAEASQTWALGWGALAVMVAALGWALDNALTRPLADFDPLEVVRWKSAMGAGLALALALTLSQSFPKSLEVVGLLACGAIGYGVSLRLYLLAQRRVGAGRTGSIFALAPFIGAAVAWAMGERAVGVTTMAAALLFGLGVYLHLTERHGHGHLHEPVEHEHAHRHDDGHHEHRHDPIIAGEHSHPHRHARLRHDHPHGPDAHHQHRHVDPVD
jgi:drug/metabolite transporter (DMT)-like permease